MHGAARPITTGGALGAFTLHKAPSGTSEGGVSIGARGWNRCSFSHVPLLEPTPSVPPVTPGAALPPESNQFGCLRLALVCSAPAAPSTASGLPLWSGLSHIVHPETGKRPAPGLRHSRRHPRPPANRAGTTVRGTPTPSSKRGSRQPARRCRPPARRAGTAATRYSPPQVAPSAVRLKRQPRPLARPLRPPR